MERVKDFTNAAVGDKFFSTGHFGRDLVIVTISKVTPKRVVIGSFQYEKIGGRGLGGERWSHPPEIYHITPEVMEKYKMKKMRAETHGRRTDDLTDDQVKRIYAIIKEQPL